MPGRQLVLLSVLALANTANAELYTWTDDQGNTHFSDRPPASVDAVPVTLSSPSVIPMKGNIRTGKKVGAIHRQIEQTLAKDRPGPNSSSIGPSAAEIKQCDKLRQRIERVQQQLRAGYSNDRGNRLRRQRRELSQTYSRDCMLG